MRDTKGNTPKAQSRLSEKLDSAFGDTLLPLSPGAWAFGLSRGTSAGDFLSVMKRLRDEESFLFDVLIDITAVDWLDKREPRFDLVYQLLSLTHLHRLSLKVAISEDTPEIPSVRPLWAAANFLEREVWDMFGIVFEGHGDLRRILLYPEFVGHPLRKDYPILEKQPRVPLRAPEERNDSMDIERPELACRDGLGEKL